MKSINYTFFQNNQWQFTIEADFSLAGFTAYCSAEREDAKINSTTSIVGNIITVTFNSTNVQKGIWKYDVEVNNGTDNFTLQRGEIQVL
jgi:hypothetical protein